MTFRDYMIQSNAKSRGLTPTSVLAAKIEQDQNFPANDTADMGCGYKAIKAYVMTNMPDETAAFLAAWPWYAALESTAEIPEGEDECRCPVCGSYIDLDEVDVNDNEEDGYGWMIARHICENCHSGLKAYFDAQNGYDFDRFEAD